MVLPGNPAGPGSPLMPGRLLNKYPLVFILKQFERVPRTFQCEVPTHKNFLSIRKIFIVDATHNNAKKAKFDFEVDIFYHFSFCKGMHDVSVRFHKL